MKWSGHRQPSRKRIQNNDSEDDPGPRKKNGEEAIFKEIMAKINERYKPIDVWSIANTNLDKYKKIHA